MQDHGGAAKTGVISTRTAEIAVAVLFLLVGAIVMQDSLRVGAGWVEPEGPRAGYFPFRIGAIMFIASLVTLVQAIMQRGRPTRPFVDRAALGQVLLILVPAVVFVAVIDVTGLYVASVVYIAGFMWWIGKYKPLISAVIGLGVAATLFLMFEIWFLVPLPKGPIEALFGY
jgi:hypothetical protein